MSETTNTPSPGEPSSSPETPQTSPDASTQALGALLQRVQTELSRAERRLNNSTTFTAIIGLILVVLLGIYFAVGYISISELMEPKMLVGFSVEQLEDGLPEARKALEAEVNESAPEWAEQLSEEAVANLPLLREKIEEKTLVEIDEQLKKASVMTSQKFREILRENRPLLEQGFEDLASNEKLSKESLDALEKALEAKMETDIEEQSQLVLETLVTLTARLKKLAKGKGLNVEEQLERQVLMNARRLQLQEADPELGNKPLPKATKGPRDDAGEKGKSSEQPKSKDTGKSKPKQTPTE